MKNLAYTGTGPSSWASFEVFGWLVRVAKESSSEGATD